MLELNKIYNMDCIDGMKQIDDNSIDMVLTSPPYDDLRKYNGYKFDINNTVKELYRILKEGGIIVWIIGDSVKGGSETLTSFKQAIIFRENKFYLHDTMIYEKNAFPFPDKTRYSQVFEYMFIFSKGKPNTTNIKKIPTRLSNRIKNKNSCYRTADGLTLPMKYETGKGFRNKKNIWCYEVGYMKTTKDKDAFKHPAMFPEALANDHILSWSNENDIILDPFVGSGTTCLMSWKNNRRFIGFEINPEYYNISLERLSNIKMQTKL